MYMEIVPNWEVSFIASNMNIDHDIIWNISEPDLEGFIKILMRNGAMSIRLDKS